MFEVWQFQFIIKNYCIMSKGKFKTLFIALRAKWFTSKLHIYVDWWQLGHLYFTTYKYNKSLGEKFYLHIRKVRFHNFNDLTNRLSFFFSFGCRNYSAGQSKSPSLMSSMMSWKQVNCCSTIVRYKIQRINQFRAKGSESETSRFLFKRIRN